MSDTKSVWEPGSPEFYLTLIKDPHNTVPQVFGDPRLNADDAADEMTEIEKYMPRMPVASLILRAAGDDEFLVREATADVLRVIERRCEERGIERKPAPDVIQSSLPFLAHVALWSDGELGSLAPACPDEDLSLMRDKVNSWMSLYGHWKENQGLTGVILRFKKSEDDWRAEVVEHLPAPETAISLEM